MSDPNVLPIAGWYPDPENEAQDRWWNGSSWSDHRRPRNVAPGWAPAGAAAPAATTAEPAVPVPPVAPAPVDRPNPYAGAAAPGVAPPPGQAPYAPAYAYNYAPRTPMQNVPAFAGMITSLIALLFNWILWGLPGTVGGIISIVGLVKANRLAASGVTTGNGRGQAIVGIATGFAGALLWNVFYFAVFQPFTFS